MNAVTLIASTTGSVAQSHSISDALPHLAGMLMVMVTLAILWGVCAFAARMVGFLTSETKPAAPVASTVDTPVATPASAATPAVDTKIAPEIVAVIAAAVAACAGRNIRIVSIKPSNSSWERAGRQSVLTSHRIR